MSIDNNFAFIVPYRDRAAHLRLFVPHIKKRFKRAEICFIEQADNKPFNRGALLNIGFTNFAINFPYAAYHDIDMLPTKADYSFPSCPTHLATKVQQFNYTMPYDKYFGGVVLFNTEDFENSDGYSNHFWGWGGEDDEFFKHITDKGIRFQRRIGYYQSLYHKRAYDGMYNPEKMKQAQLPRNPYDNYHTTDYHVLSVEDNFFGCTKISVEL